VAAALLSDCGSGGGKSKDAPTTSTTESSLQTFGGPPPWPLGSNQAARIAAAGLPGYKAEGSVVHYHAHLDVFYNGQPVRVPQFVGIDYQTNVISPMHTHFDTGVVHIEAASDDTFTLGEFLTEWGIRVRDDCVSDMCGDSVATFVNGSVQDDFAGDVPIRADTEIVLVLGTPPKNIPSGYTCVNPNDACPNTPTK
jgi:hypothetical protein